jgi:hypothetical protein
MPDLAPAHTFFVKRRALGAKVRKEPEVYDILRHNILIRTASRLGFIWPAFSLTFFVLTIFIFGALAPLAAQSNPVPLITPPLLPTAVAPGSSGFTLTVNGTGFAAGSVVTWNGSSRATTVVSSSQLTATILASDVASVGTAAISVVSPAPGGGTSNVLFFPINQPTASVSTIETNITVGNYASSIAQGDFNRDGKPDLAVVSIVTYCGYDCEGNGFVNILLGNGDGTFTVGPNIPTQFWATSVTVGDFNRDGKLDLAIAYGDTYEVPTGVAILFGNGDGTFTTGPTTAGTGQTSDSIAAGDFNGDGILDLAMTNECSTPGLSCPSSSVTIFLGNGDGTFTVASAPTVGFAQQVTVGDFNGDGKLDLAVEGGEVSILLGNGDGTFTPGEVLLQASNIRAVSLADFNGDGKLDFAGFINCIVYPCVSGEVVVYTGNGDGTFTAAPSFNTPLGTWTGSVGDFNQDGIVDIAVDAISSGGDDISFALGKGAAVFTEGAAFPAGPYPTQTAVADFNGDGKLDVATVSVCADGGECYTTYDGLVAILLQTATVALTPGNLSFPTQVIGTTSYYQPVNLNNNGTTPINIENIRTSGSFAQTNSCGTTLASGAACTINVTFTPRTKNTQTGSLVVTEDSPRNSQTISLSGLGTAVSLSPTGLAFGEQAVGTTSPPQTTVLTNVGSGPLNITKIEVTGSAAPAGEFIQTNNCGSSLPAGKSCTIGVVFAPTFASYVRAYLSVATNGGGGTQFVELFGVGKFGQP